MSTPGVLEYCEKHEMYSCVCSRPRVPRQDAALWGPWVPAKTPGECKGGCNGRIVPGQQVRSDGHRGWLCTTCGNA